MVHFPTQKGKKHVPKHTHFGACNKAICKTYKPPVQDLHHSVQCGTTHTFNITFCSGKLCSILISWLNAIKQVSFIDGFRNAGSFRFSHSKCLFPQLEKANWHGPRCCIHPRTRSRRCQCYLRFKTRPRNTHVDPRDTLHRRRRESLSDRVCEWEEGRGGGGGEAGPGTARPSSTTAATTLSEPLADPPLLLHQTAMLPPHFCNSASPLLSFRHHISSAFTPAFTPGVGRLLPPILPSPHLASSRPILITRLRHSNPTFSSHYGSDNNNPSTMSTKHIL